MKLNDQLKKERENRGHSQSFLKARLESVKVYVSLSTIKDWESGKSQIPPNALVAISRFYEISIDDLVDPTVDPKIDMESEYYKFGKSIHNYCGSTDATSFFQEYQIFDKSTWVPSPKYDLIMRLYTIYLKKPRSDFFTTKITYDVFKDWTVSYFDKTSSKERTEIHSNIFKDSAGWLDPNDRREPVNSSELNQEVYELKSDLGYFIENYTISNVEVTLWNYLEN